MMLVLVTTITALLVAGGALLINNLVGYRSRLSEELATDARILALSTAPALQFEDRAAARRNVQALQARPEIMAVAVYDARNALYAQYLRPGQPQLPAIIGSPADRTRITHDRIALTYPIIRNGERVGTIYLQAGYDVLGQLRTYAEILSIVLALSILIALVLSARLQRALSRPLEAITQVAGEIIRRRDYSPRVSHREDGELGLVIEAFNRMLDEVQLREANLQASEARYRATFENAAVGIAQVGLDGRWLRFNQAVCQITGYSGEALERLTFAEITHPEDVEADWAQARQVANGERASYMMEKRYIRPDRSIVWVRLTVSAMPDAAGRPLHFIAIIEDITAQKRVQEQLTLLAEELPALAWMARPDGWIHWYNRRWYEYTGKEPEEMEGWGWESVHDPEELPRVKSLWQASLSSGEPFEMTFPLRGADGVYRPFLTRIVPFRDSTGKILSWFGTNTDVSSERAIQARLAEKERELTAANARLREVDRQKDEFLAMLAHELRNPLAPLSNASALLGHEARTNPRLSSLAAIVARQVSQLTRLVSDLLDVSRITLGRITLKQETLEIHEVVEQAIETVQPLISQKSHRLRVEKPGQPIYVNGDRARLVQTLGNLLNNAAKYTDPGGEITLSVCESADAVTFEVRDSGAGISADLLPQVFDLFVQDERSLDRSQGGLGIGLAVVKRLVEMHGGTVAAASGGPGRGSSFIVRLPRAQAPVLDFETPAEPAGHGQRILVVDDNQDAAESLKMLLVLDGHEVSATYSAADALQALEHSRPDVVLLDIGLPGMDGHELARQMRSNEATKGAVLIALTGYEQEQGRAREAGFNAYLRKPPDLQVLRRLLASGQPPGDHPSLNTTP
jgi:PAS domain S-box-containing protein